MKKSVLILCLFAFFLTGCRGQNKEAEKDTPKEDQPIEDIKVTKEYDENGNLISFDSIYSSYYSNIENNPFRADSILGQFKSYFNEYYHFSDSPYFNNLFFQDSLMKFDFYKEDFFSNRFRNNMSKMNQLFWDMDSLKNHFFNEQISPKDDQE